MFFRGQGRIEIVRSSRRSTTDVYFDLNDRTAAELILRQFKGDCSEMGQLRAALAETEPFLFGRSDDDVIAMLASQLVSGQLLLKDPNGRSTQRGATADGTLAVSEPSAQRPMSGYFTLLKYVLRARSLEHLEELAGYRRGRLSAKGLLIYRFLRVPEITEFEVRGSTITPEHKWNAEDAKVRLAELAKVAAYHRNTGVPSFDEIQRKNARETMDVSGDNTPVKLYPLDSLDSEVYPPGHGIPQWRLTDEVKRKGSVPGVLLFRIDPLSPLPWVE